MSNFDTIKDSYGKEYLVFDSSELYDDSQVGNKSEDFEILRKLGEGAFGKVFKVRSKKNNKVYAMKQLNITELKEENEKAYQLTVNETSFLEGLSHQHIIKYYKNFTEKDYLYIIIEYVANGDVAGYIEAHKIFKKHISEEDLWNIFLQSMDALSYVHSMGVIHRDIKPANLLMDNNMVVKLGDFGVSALKNKDENNQYLNGKYCPFKNKEKMKYGGTYVGTKNYMAKEIMDENDYDQKVDVYSMGVSFFEMCYFHMPKKVIKRKDNNNNYVYSFQKIEMPEDKNVKYSKELLNIIELMLEEDKNKRKTSGEILKMIQDEYSKKYVKNSSIDALFRCLYSCSPLTNKFLQLPQNEIFDKNVTKSYINCLQSVTNPSLIAWINSIGLFRQVLCSENPKLAGTKEIEPRFVFAFFLQKLHKELNKSTTLMSKNKHLIISGEEESKTSKVEVMFKFVSDLYSKFNSIISNDFLGLMKITNLCRQCQLRTFSFNSFFFITFNLEKILKNNFTQQFNLQEQLIKQKDYVIENQFYCSKCLTKTAHNTFKEYYSLPNILIISIQRGLTFSHKNPIIISQELDLTKSIEFEYSKKTFNLVGILGRREDGEGNELFFSIVYLGNQWYYCLQCSEYIIKPVDSLSNANSFGDILMLFYK